MNNWEMENAINLAIALKETGFQISQICCSRPSCFDFAARKNDKTLIIKINSDVDTFSPKDSRELKIIAGSTHAASLIISQQTHGKPLADDTVYTRNNIPVITQKTIKGIAQETANPLVYACPGGYTVQIDGTLIEQKRKQLGLSVGKLAEKISVSRTTLRSYEKGKTKASVTSAYKLAKTLGIPVAKPINIFQKTHKPHQCLLIYTKHNQTQKTYLHKILKKFTTCDITPIYKAPFDFIMNTPNNKHTIIGCITTNKEKNPNNRIEETLNFCNVTHAHPTIITEKQKQINKDVSCICMDKLSVIRTPEDLIATV
jgi:predicted transcriptional regulator